MQKGIKTRYIVHKILKNLKYESITFDKAFLLNTKKENLIQSDVKMIHNITLNAIRNHISIDKIIKKFLVKKKISVDSYLLFLSAITQILYLEFKEFAVVNSTVEICKYRKINASSNFINAVLRNVIRNKAELKKIKISFNDLPNWFTKQVVNWDNKKKDDFIKTISKEPDLHLVFKNKNDIDKLKIDEILTTNKSIVVKKKSKIEEINGYKQGLWWIQDFSTMLPLHLTEDIKNKITADLCSAPGGKTFQLINYGAKVDAFEINPARYKKMQANLNRLRMKCNFVLKDLFKINEKKKYDLIILDAPCSSIGTIRRHPEILYRNKKPDFNKLALLQKKMLEKAKKILNTNGIIIYMVCSFFSVEGEKQIKDFLKNNKNFSVIKFQNQISNIKCNITNKNGNLSLIPLEMSNGLLIDGFFAAKLIKNA